MNRLLYYSALVSLFVVCSCQKMDVLHAKDEAEPSSEIETDGSANPLERFSVSFSDARHYAELHNPGASYSIDPYVEGKDTLLYVLNFKEGWMILSGDRRTDPVIAMDTKGSISIDKESESGFWILSYAQAVARLKKDTGQEENSWTALWEAISPSRRSSDMPQTKAELKWVIREGVLNEFSRFEETVPPMTRTRWGQGSHWNDKCPLDARSNYQKRATPCCVAVAFAQVLYYWHYHAGWPSKLSHYVYCNQYINSSGGAVENIGFKSSDLHENSPRWDEMALSNTASARNLEYVGNFLLEVGHYAKIRYSSNGSEGKVQNAAKPLSNFYGFSYELKQNPSEAYIKAKLQSQKPIIIYSNGRDRDNNELIGHAWIIDGYSSEFQHYTMLRYCEQSTDWGLNDEVYDTFAEAQAAYGFSAPYEMIPFTRDIERIRYHMNWGEGGRGDGYFSSQYDYTFNQYTFPHTDIGTCCVSY